MANYKKQPKNLKKVQVNGMSFYFEMNVTKKQMRKIFDNPMFEYYKKTFGKHISTITIETNSVWYDVNGNCFISAE